MATKNTSFAWNTLRAIVGGSSAIDVPRLHVSSFAEAEAFLECYGFSWDDPSRRAELEVLRREALAFLDDELLPDPWNPDARSLEIDPAVRAEKDVRALLSSASGGSEDPVRQRWICAVLRVMHTLAHTKMYFNEQYGDEIRAQILSRITPHLFGAERRGNMTLGRGEDAVDLVHFHVKHTKPLHSVALKLLHKVENVATDIFDRIGVRLVTRERFDALRAVHYLRVNHVMMFANIKPSRSRNTLLDLDWLEVEIAALDALVEQGVMTREGRTARLRHLARHAAPPDPPQPADNLFSSSEYRSLQFTCRQKIRIRDPQGLKLDELAIDAAARFGPDDPLVDELRRRAEAVEEVRFFFPFEVQILDVESFEQARSGRASHDEYKARQREAARSRVLGALLGPTVGATSGNGSNGSAG